MADALCAAEDVALVLGITADGTTTPRLEAMARQASSFARAYTRQELTAHANDVVVLDAFGGDELWLPELPVTSLDSVTTIDRNGDETVRPIGEFLFVGRNGLVRWVNGSFPCATASVRVEYAHGHDPVPDDLKDAAASIAARAFLTGPGIVGEGVGSTNWRVRVEHVGGLTRFEQQTFDAYRLRDVA